MSDYQPQYGNEPQKPYDAPAQRRGMSGCAKAFLIIGALGVVSLLACCIGGWFYIRSAVITDPVEAKAVADKIIDWQFNDELDAKFAGNFFFARMAFLSDPQKGLVMVADSKYANAEDMGKQLDGQFRSQMSGAKGGGQIEDTEMIEEGERDVEIKGETISFSFDKTRGVDSGETYFETIGIVPGKEYPTFVMLKLRESAFSEQDILDRLAGIK